jgi:hypothetical protein
VGFLKRDVEKVSIIGDVVSRYSDTLFVWDFTKLSQLTALTQISTCEKVDRRINDSHSYLLGPSGTRQILRNPLQCEKEPSLRNTLPPEKKLQN